MIVRNEYDVNLRQRVEAQCLGRQRRVARRARPRERRCAMRKHGISEHIEAIELQQKRCVPEPPARQLHMSEREFDGKKTSMKPTNEPCCTSHTPHART